MWTRKRAIELLHEDLGGHCIEGKWGSGPYLVVPYKDWEIIFDYFIVSTGQSAITYTRLRTVFKNQKNFDLKVSKEGFFSKIGKALGGQDIEIGDENFDGAYIVKSSDDLIATRLLSHHDIKSKMNFDKAFHLDIIKKNQMGIKCIEGELGMTYLTAHVIKDHETIKLLIELFQTILDVMVNQELIVEKRAETILIKSRQLDE